MGSGQWVAGSGRRVVVAVQQYVGMQRMRAVYGIWEQDQDPREQHLDNKWTSPRRPFWMASVTTGSTPVTINASCCPLQARSSHPCRPELAR